MTDKYTQPDRSSQNATEYTSNIDNSIAIHHATSGAFHCSQQDIADMTIAVSSGRMMSGNTLISISGEDISALVAPSANPRIDRVVISRTDGTITVITGSEASSPSAPSLTADTIPLCQILLATTTTTIVNSMITDERVVYSGAAGASVGANLQSIEDNTGTAADKGIYYTAADTAAEFGLTAAGRAILDDANNTAQRSTLGLGTLATQSSSSVSISGGSVSGITDIAIADGGTGQSSKTAAFDALSPLSTQGDIMYHNGSDNVRLAKGTALYGLRMNAGATAPEWAEISAAGYTPPTLQTLTDAASITWDVDSGTIAIVTLGGNRALSNPTNLVAGMTLRVIVKQDGTGTRTLSYGNYFRFPGSVEPVISTGASDIDILEFLVESSTVLHLTNVIFDSLA